MNATTFAKLLVVCAAGLAAVTGAQAKGASLSVGLTIVSSCAVSGASAYQAATSNAAVVAGCGAEASYTVSMSKAEAPVATREEGQAGRARNDAGYVTVTLTY